MKRFVPFMKSTPLVAVIRLSGVISTGRGGLNDQTLAPMIERAFAKGKPKAVALVINSPGGSPVQSSLISARIRRLSEEKEIPVYAFVEDVAASGGYWLACAADQIFVDATSIIGSIGVISASFGFDKVMANYGVERRIHTAGKSKSFMDPFSPQKAADVKRIKSLQEPIHQAFINHVQTRRGTRLDENAEMFGGEIWVGQQALDVGIADGIAHVSPKMKELFGDKTRFRTYGPKKSALSRFGLSLVDETLLGIEERNLRAGFGL
ncbi:peptidase S49 [Rhodobacterales bacterium HTCC2150]|nr:peptidase S49 [Rhodobacterales bacterium HTCC2150] [Rhodobacteraceae bacterium HTCC2150]